METLSLKRLYETWYVKAYFEPKIHKEAHLEAYFKQKKKLNEWNKIAFNQSQKWRGQINHVWSWK